MALVEQPYRVAGRRSPAPAHQLDTAWTAVVEHLSTKELASLPLITGGRSAGARVACRTAEATGAAAVLCLAFPLLPPRRAKGKPPESRLPELDAVAVPMLIVQGEGDQFGMPPAAKRREVVRVAGNHALKSDLEAVGLAVEEWLATLALTHQVVERILLPHPRLVAALAATAALAVAASSAEAAPSVTPPPAKLKVMTRNIYLGGDIFLPVISKDPSRVRAEVRRAVGPGEGDQLPRAREAARARDQEAEARPDRPAGGRPLAARTHGGQGRRDHAGHPGRLRLQEDTARRAQEGGPEVPRGRHASERPTSRPPSTRATTCGSR